AKIAGARAKIAEIPPRIQAATADPCEAQWVVMAMLVHESGAQDTALAIAQAFAQDPKFATLYATELARERYIDVIHLAIASLKLLSPKQYGAFRASVRSLIAADQKLSWFELNLCHLVLFPLDITFGLAKAPDEAHSHLGAIKQEVEALLSFAAYMQFKDDGAAQTAFESCIRRFGTTALRYTPSGKMTTNALQNAYNQIARAKPVLRRKILEMTLFCLNSDGNLSTQDIETAHALCAVLRLPISL
ncbi:MAG: hypothetical protein LBL69_03855, partial [Zoogloeaceae bacterium]|nr:hypothetical protein [Zoogloeaceae bacterium]